MTLNNFIRGLKQFSLWHDHQIDLYLYATRSRRTWVRVPLTDTLLLQYGGFIIDDMRVADGHLACYINAVYSQRTEQRLPQDSQRTEQRLPQDSQRPEQRLPQDSRSLSNDCRKTPEA